MNFFKKYSGLILVIILSIFSLLPLFHAGFFPFHDNTQVERTFEMGKALKDGMFPVRWVEDLGYGYGYPIFNFYSPLPYYIGGFLNVVGFDALLATKITFIIGILLSGIFMYLFVKNFLGKLPALVVSTVYVFFPYHAVNIYVRGALDEFYAYAFLPLVLLGFYRIYYISKKNEKILANLKWIFVAGSGLAFVILSHNLTAFMLLLFLFLLLMSSIIVSKNKLKLLFFYFFALLLGFTLSAFYSVPAILEMKYTNVTSQIGGGANYFDHFVCLNQLWNSPWGYGGSALGCTDGMSFKLGKQNVILSLIALFSFVYLIFKRRIKEKRFFYLSVLAFLGLSIFMLIDFSEFFWQAIPNMSFLQYPWRFLNFTGLFLSLTVGILIVIIRNFVSNKAAIFFTIFIILITLTYNYRLFSPKEFNNYDANYYINSNHVKWTTSKISDEYMPKNFNKPEGLSQISTRPIQIKNGDGVLNEVYTKTGFISYELNLTSNSLVKLNIAYFPSWKVYLNGKEQVFEVKNDGLYIDIPSGFSTLEIRFIQNQIEKISNLLTLGGVLLLFFGIIINIKYRNH